MKFNQMLTQSDIDQLATENYKIISAEITAVNEIEIAYKSHSSKTKNYTIIRLNPDNTWTIIDPYFGNIAQFFLDKLKMKMNM